VSFTRIGDVLYYSNGVERGMVGPGSDREDWGTLPVMNDPALVSYLFRPMPAGSIIRTYKARLLAARGPRLYYSEPYAFNVYRPARGYIPFLADVTLVVPMSTGIFVAADRTYWLPGDIAATSLKTVLAYGGIPGTDARASDNTAMWLSPRGLIRGQDDGSATNLQEKHVAIDGGQRGASLYRESDGTKKAITAVSGREESRMAAHTYMSAEIIRKASPL